MKKDRHSDSTIIRITSDPSMYLHTCGLSTISQRRAIKSSGWSQPDIEGLNQIIPLLRDSYLDNIALRAYLQKSVHSFTDMDDQWLRNFRRKVMKYVIDPSLQVKKSDLPQLQHGSNIAANEDIILDSDTKKQNFRNHLLQIMQDSGEGWNVIKILSKVEEENTGFCYCIWFDSNDKPIGICWMSSNMKKRLLRYGDIIFLDAQKRQYNKHGWVYIGPCVRDNNNRTCTVIECLCIEESIDSYSWVMGSMFQMESKFQKEYIKLIFGDDFLTDALLVKLGINNTCILCSDFFHCLKLTWPKYFGPVIWAKISNSMSALLYAATEETWQSCFEIVKSQVQKCGQTRFAEYIETRIYNNPKRYSSYFLKKIEGNRLFKGSTPAEQNHSSNIARLGKGATWELAKQASELLQRDRDLSQQKANKDIEWFHGNEVFVSNDDDDIIARKLLSKYAYEELWLNVMKQAKCLMITKLSDQSSSVHKIGEHPNTGHIVKLGERCNCTKRVAMMIQCVHEYKIDGKFIIEKYNKLQWISTHSYIIDLQSLSPSNVSPSLFEHTKDTEDTMSEDSSVQRQLPHQCKKGSQMHTPTFNEVVNLAKEGARCAQNDSTTMRAFASAIDQMIETMRQGSTVPHFNESIKEFNTSFQNATLSTKSGNDSVAVPSITTFSTSASRQKRLRSSVECQRNAKSSFSPKCIDVSIDKAVLGVPNQTQRKCSVCGLTGHIKTSCVIQMAYGTFLSHSDINSLSTSITNPGSFITEKRDENDSVHDEFPSKHVCIIIRKRKFLFSNAVPLHDANNYCYECSVVGRENKTIIDCGTFSSPCIVKYLASQSKTSNKKVISQLRTSLQKSDPQEVFYNGSLGMPPTHGL